MPAIGSYSMNHNACYKTLIATTMNTTSVTTAPTQFLINLASVGYHVFLAVV